MSLKTILVVEDEPLIAENISYALSTEGFLPVCCQTAADAMEALARQPVELVLLDLGLPDAGGFDVLGRIRALGATPVIVVTARAAEVDRVAGLEMGADDYVVKPFSPRELTARVRAVLRRIGENRKAGSNPSLASTSFSVDEKRLRITFLGTILALSPTEFRLLLLFLENPGRVFSRRQLMERIWEDPGMSLERTVDAHVKTLRKKLREVNPEADPILTHRGMGYSLREDA